MKTTANYGLKKPEGSDTVNIDDFNYNADMVDSELVKRALKTDILTKTSQLNNDSGFITSAGAPVLSVNSKVGNIILVSNDIGAEPSITKNTAFNQNFETNASNIRMDGTASIGTSSNVARADHVHPTDTTKVNQSDFNTHLTDITRHVTKDKVLQTGLNTELVNGVHVFVQATDPSLVTINNATNNDIWFNTTSGNEIMNIRVGGAWIPSGAVYK